MVRVPDAAAQVRGAPVKALRGFFAGIGQLLVSADRLRAEETQSGQAPRDRAQATDPHQHRQNPHEPADRDQNGEPDRYEPLTAARAPSAARHGRDSGRRDNRAGRHRATGLQGPAASAQTPTRRFRSLDSTGNVRLLSSDDAASAAEDQPAADPAPAAAAVLAVSADDLPVPGYDQLTIASLRSRLRYLDIAQLQVLADYERATANRVEFVGMFERRIVKLQAAAARAT